MAEPISRDQAQATDQSSQRTWRATYADGVFEVEAPAPDTLRISLTPRGAPPHRTWSVDADADPSTWSELLQREDGANVSLQTSALLLTIRRDVFQFSVGRADGSEMLAHVELAMEGGRPRWTSSLPEDARVYGGGERTGALDRRGRTLTFWATDPKPNFDDATDAMYQSVPFLITLTDGLAHGIFFDSTAHATADIGATRAGELAYSTVGADVVAYVFAGPTLGAVLRQYTAVTGRMPQMPRWALGNQQSRWSYMTTQELLDIAARFRQERIPCDALYLDIDYMRGFRDFTWDTDRFPDPAGMIRALHDQQYRVVTIIDPGIKVDEDYQVYRDGVQRGFLVRDKDGEPFEGWVWPGRSVWADFAQSEVRAWWGEQHRALVEMGVAGIWIDMNEPTQADMWAPTDVKISHGASLPLDTSHGTEREPLSHAEFHNAYAIEMARSTYDSLVRLAPERRPFVLTRAAGAGSQRYTAVWNGDTTSSWDHLRMSVALNLGVSLSGFPLTGGDIGGFWQDTTPELLVRWTQLGALLPFCRNHSAIETVRQEPWAFGEPFTRLCRSAIELRYRLMPYLVTLAHQASCDGAPLIRPLAWIAPTHAASLACDDQFLLGDSMLVAPVLDEGAVERRVVLPPGEWFSWQTDEVYTGGQTVVIPVDLEITPLFVRSGSILPLAGVTQTTADEYIDPLTVHIYLTQPGQSSSATLWDDDDSPDAERQGRYASYELSAEWRDDGMIEVFMARVGGNLAFRFPGVRLHLHLPHGHETTPESEHGMTHFVGDSVVARIRVTP